ncbi:MAG: M48 family metalloprotease [Gemmatimonadota bacterium]
MAACATNPATGRRMLSLVSESQEIEMGRSYSQQIESTMSLYDDDALQTYVNDIGQRLAATSERPSLPWSFKVVDDPVVNAFALPGGFIYVTRGIMTHFNSEAALASVIGHEIGHVTARHSVEQMSRAQLGSLAIGVGSIVSEDVRRFGGVAQTALGVLFLSYGRNDESESDMLSVRYAVREGYDPREAIGVHEMLARQTAARGGSGVPSWLSTHPSSADRIDRIRAQVDTIPPSVLNGTRVLADEYLARIDGAVFGADPRQGFFRGEQFLHPQLAFTLQFPAGWQTANLTQAVQAQSPDEDAIMELTLASGGHAAAADDFFGQDDVRGRDVRTSSVNGAPATSGEFEVRTRNGTIEGVATFLDFDGRTYRLLGYTPQGGMAAYRTVFRTSIGSFEKLTERAALHVEPLRIELVTVQRSTTVGLMAAGRPSVLSAEDLAILNGVEVDEEIEPGRTVKWVVGEPPPGAHEGS